MDSDIFVGERDENADILPEDLSGDENVERSFVLNEAAKSTATKASTCACS